MSKEKAEKVALQIEGASGGNIIIGGLHSAQYPSKRFPAYFYFSDGTIIKSESTGVSRHFEVKNVGSKLNVVIEQYGGYEIVDVFGIVDWYICRIEDARSVDNHTIYCFTSRTLEPTELELTKYSLLNNPNVILTGEANKDTYIANVLRSTFKNEVLKNY